MPNDNDKRSSGLIRTEDARRRLTETLTGSHSQYQFNEMTLRHIGVLIEAVQLLLAELARLAADHDKLAKGQGDVQAASKGVAKRVSQIERKIRQSEREFKEVRDALKREGIGKGL